MPSRSEDINAYEYSVLPAATNKRESFIARRGWSLPLHGLERGRATKRCFSQDLSERVWYLIWANGLHSGRLFAKLFDGLRKVRRTDVQPKPCTYGIRWSTCVVNGELTIVYNLRETWVRTRRSVRERWEVIRMRMSDGKESRDMLHCQVKSWVCYLTQRAYSVN